MGGKFFPHTVDGSQTKVGCPPVAPKFMELAGPKKWDPTTEPDLGV